MTPFDTELVEVVSSFGNTLVDVVAPFGTVLVEVVTQFEGELVEEVTPVVSVVLPCTGRHLTSNWKVPLRRKVKDSECSWLCPGASWRGGGGRES